MISPASEFHFCIHCWSREEHPNHRAYRPYTGGSATALRGLISSFQLDYCFIRMGIGTNQIEMINSSSVSVLVEIPFFCFEIEIENSDLLCNFF